MQVTRRFFEVSALGGFLALLAVVADQPWFLLGAAGVGAWLLAQQYAFLRALVETDETLTVDQRVSRTRTPTDQPVQVTLTATRTERTPSHSPSRRILPSRRLGRLPPNGNWTSRRSNAPAPPSTSSGASPVASNSTRQRSPRRTTTASFARRSREGHSPR
ncbi:hypothetical protein [Haladaptatus sp. GCM10025893]|uniref:hypothetical protein n=1 Tax=Haladaptatus sp. GCM10025893 TaxID=3252659 RepID=UPI00360C1E9E